MDSSRLSTIPQLSLERPAIIRISIYVLVYLAEKVWNASVSTAQEARATLDGIYVRDEDFRASFIAKQGLTNQKAAYLLRMIEHEERNRKLGGTASELQPGQHLTVEHILPKNPGNEWQEEMAADSNLVHDCALRFGNMCLLSQPRNRLAARKGFEQKKTVYKSSEVLTTRQITNHCDWNRKSIEQHQTWLASRAVDIWKFS